MRVPLVTIVKDQEQLDRIVRTFEDNIPKSQPHRPVPQVLIVPPDLMRTITTPNNYPTQLVGDAGESVPGQYVLLF